MTSYIRRPLFRRGSGGTASSYWRGSQRAEDIPETAILTEDGEPILGAGSEFLLTES